MNTASTAPGRSAPRGMSRPAPPLLLLAGILLFTAAQAQTVVEGEVSGVWTPDGSPYQVVLDDISVAAGDSLVIEPGVAVHFWPNRSFTIYGTLVAVGEPGDSIRFSWPSVIPNPGSWVGMTFSGVSSSGSTVARAIISSGTDNLTIQSGSSPHLTDLVVEAPSFAAVTIEGGNPRFDNLRIGFGINSDASYGLRITGGRPVVQGGRITDAPVNGVQVTGEAVPTLADLLIESPSNNGVYLHDIEGATLSGIRVENAGVRGIFADGCSSLTLDHNEIWRSVASGLYISGGSGHTLSYNTVLDAGYGSTQNSNGLMLGTNTNATLFGNIVAECSGVGFWAQNVVTSSYSCYWNNAEGSYGAFAFGGVGDIEQDPQFVQPAFGNIDLNANSPCIDAGNPSDTDPDGTRADIGARFYNQNTRPVIDGVVPEDPLLQGYSWGDVIDFSVTAHDPDPGHEISYRWTYRGEEISTASTASIVVRSEQGDSVVVELDDGYYEGVTRFTWTFDAVPVNDEPGAALPERFAVAAVHPNPFNAATRVTLTVPRRGTVRLAVYDVLGRKIAARTRSTAGGRESFTLGGADWSSGVYFLRASFGDESVLVKVVLIR